MTFILSYNVKRQRNAVNIKSDFKKVLFGVTMTQYIVNDVIQILKLHSITGFLNVLAKTYRTKIRPLTCLISLAQYVLARNNC